MTQRVILYLTVAIAIAGCNKPVVCTKPEPANLWVQGGHRQNLSDRGEPLPVQVRFYQLSNLGELEQASFDEMRRAPEEVLGDTLLATEKLTVYPGRSEFRSFERDPGANYVVGVAIVRQPSGNQWRSVLEMPSCTKRDGARPMARFSIEGYTIAGRIGRDSDPEGCDDDDTECLRARAERR